LNSSTKTSLIISPNMQSSTPPESHNIMQGLAVERQIQDLTDPPLEVCALLPLRKDI